jgi:hypothetical protein
MSADPGCNSFQNKLTFDGFEPLILAEMQYLHAMSVICGRKETKGGN